MTEQYQMGYKQAEFKDVGCIQLSKGRSKWRTVMTVQYGDNYIRHRAAYDEVHRFKKGRMSIVGNARPAQPLAATFVHVNNLKAKFPLN